MQSLKRMVIVNLQRLLVVMMVLILCIAVLLQVFLLQNQARENAQASFLQIGQILKENAKELENVRADYETACLLNAESIAYMIQYHPEILGDVQEFRRIAKMMQVDEIHIFDNTGRIFTGTHPEYYDFTFDTGEQIGFFKPMMTDKSLKLCQEITPNTAEGILVQYSAVWSADGNFIVQVGMYPETVKTVMAKNEISYIFSLLQSHPGVDFYAIDAASGEIEGATTGGDHGKHMTQIGFRMEDVQRYKRGTHVKVSGVDSFCVFTEMDGTLLGYVTSVDTLYSNILDYTVILALFLFVLVVFFVVAIRRFTKRYIIDSISGANEKLRAVTQGNLDERVDEHSSLEFSELSSHINDMIRSLLASTDKISFILNRTNMRIGAYEYNKQMRSVRFTEHVPEILGLSSEEMAYLAEDHERLRKFVDDLRRSPVAGESSVFCLDGNNRYVKLEEIDNGGDMLGIIMDVTEEKMTQRRIETERDIDLLTGLYNRRGLEQRLEGIFSEMPAEDCGAMIMLDADGLKDINDIYGHAVGDIYLKRIADVVRQCGMAQHLSARLGGDEFVLVLYGYENEADVQRDLERLHNAQNNTKLYLEGGREIAVRFSFGYVLTRGRRDYQAMISEADGNMYEIKRTRKRTLNRG